MAIKYPTENLIRLRVYQFVITAVEDLIKTQPVKI